MNVSKRILALLTIAVVLSLGVATYVGYAYAQAFSIQAQGSVSVTGSAGGISIVSATYGGASCTVSTAINTINCSPASGSVGSVVTFSVTLQNNGASAVPLTVSTSNPNPAIATITASSSNPAFIAAGSTATLQFGVNCVSPGFAGWTVTIS